MNKGIIFAIFLILFISVVYAEKIDVSIPNPSLFINTWDVHNAKLDNPYTILWDVSDANANLLPKDSLNCSFFTYPSGTFGTFIAGPANKTIMGEAWYKTIPSTFLNKTDTYSYQIDCIMANNASKSGVYLGDFYVTPTGLDITLPYMLGFIFIIIIIVVLMFWSISGLTESIQGYIEMNKKSDDDNSESRYKYNSRGWVTFFLSVSYLSIWVLFFMLWYFTSSFVWMAPVVSQTLWILWRITSWMIPFFILGIIAWIIITNMTENLINDLERKGYSREDARRMAKHRR